MSSGNLLVIASILLLVVVAALSSEDSRMRMSGGSRAMVGILLLQCSYSFIDFFIQLCVYIYAFHEHVWIISYNLPRFNKQ